MEIRFTCPSCGAKLALSEEFAGGEVRCPKCGVASVAPAAVETIAEGPTETAAAVPGRNQRPCPACSEPYDAWTPRCPHCDEWYDDAVRRKHGIEPADCTPDDDEYLTPLDWVIGIFCSSVGCVLTVVYLCQGKPKWKKLFLISLGMQVLLSVVVSAARRGRL